MLGGFVLFIIGSVCKQVVWVKLFRNLKQFNSSEFFYQWTLWIGTLILSLILKIQDQKFMLKFMMVLCLF